MVATVVKNQDNNHTHTHTHRSKRRRFFNLSREIAQRYQEEEVEVEKQANNFHIIVNCNHNIIHPGIASLTRVRREVYTD